jgi:hypothetical protein
MEGQAADWAREYSTGQMPATWEQFKQLLISTYGGGRNIAATETELFHLRQGTKSIATYITEYNDLLALLPNVCKYVVVTGFIGPDGRLLPTSAVRSRLPRPRRCWSRKITRRQPTVDKKVSSDDGRRDTRV